MDFNKVYMRQLCTCWRASRVIFYNSPVSCILTAAQIFQFKYAICTIICVSKSIYRWHSSVGRLYLAWSDVRDETSTAAQGCWVADYAMNPTPMLYHWQIYTLITRSTVLLGDPKTVLEIISINTGPGVVLCNATQQTAHVKICEKLMHSLACSVAKSDFRSRNTTLKYLSSTNLHLSMHYLPECLHKSLTAQNFTQMVYINKQQQA